MKILVCLSLAFATLCHAAPREWTDVTGRKLTASFLRSDAQGVVVNAAGKEFTLPLAKLSAADQEWVKLQATAQPPSTAAAASGATAGGLSLAGQALKAGGRVEITVPLSPALQEQTAKITKSFDSDKELEMTQALFAIAVPEDFDPAKTWPILIISVTNSGNGKKDGSKGPSSVRSVSGFQEAALAEGWVVLGADLPGNVAPGLPANRCALAQAALDAMAAQWPQSKSWPVATAGFSGGAKYSGWVGGWMAEQDRTVLGMFMGGCNEDMAAQALNAFRPNKKLFTAAKVFLSAGEADTIASPADTAKVAKSMEGNGFTTKTELHRGGHQLNKEHITAALKWFRESPEK